MNESPKLRVLHVLNRLEHSGAEVMLAVAADLWDDEAVDAEIAAKASSPGNYAAELRRRGYTLAHLDPSPSAALPLRLAALVRRHRIDVVHVHTEHANFWLAVAARASGARVVRTVHAQFGFHGGLRAERSVQRMLLRALGVSSVAVSSTVSSHEKEHFGNPTRIIANWIDAEAFRPVEEAARVASRDAQNIPFDRLVLVSVGNCDPVKRHDVILEMARRLPQAIYIHVGAEDPAESDRALANELGVAHRVRFCGPTDDVMPYLLAADVFVVASDREGAPVSAMEALACGIPCLLRDIPVLREVAGRTAARFFSTVDDATTILATLDVADLRRWRAESERAAAEVRAARSARRGVHAYAAIYREGR